MSKNTNSKNSALENAKSHLTDVYVINTIMNNSEDTIYFKDRDSRFLLNSKAHLEQLNRSDSSDIIGKSDFDFFPDEFARKSYNDEQQIIKTGKPIINKEERWDHPDGSSTWLSASKYPLHDDAGNIIGIWGTSRDITQLKQTQMELERVNSQLRDANKKLEILSSSDSLSGLYNHRYFHMEFNKAFDLCTRQREKEIDVVFSLILLDIDCFKDINDTYGHLTGDFAIRHLSDLIRGQIRFTDMAFRYGGDEFVILLHGTDNSGAHTVAEKIRSTIEAYPVCTEQTNFHMTISGGVISFDEVSSQKEMLELVDKRLYISKESGRNRITS